MTGKLLNQYFWIHQVKQLTIWMTNILLLSIMYLLCLWIHWKCFSPLQLCNPCCQSLKICQSGGSLQKRKILVSLIPKLTSNLLYDYRFVKKKEINKKQHKPKPCTAADVNDSAINNSERYVIMDDPRVWSADIITSLTLSLCSFCKRIRNYIAFSCRFENEDFTFLLYWQH